MIYSKIPAIIADLKPIGKDAKNQQQGWNFRGIDQVYDALMPLMAKHKVFTIPNVIDSKTEERKTRNGASLIYRVLTIEYTFYAEDGSFVKAAVIGEGMDSGDKAANKAMSIAHKYALFQALCIATKEVEDPDRESHDASEPVYTGTPSQKEEIKAILRELGTKLEDQQKRDFHKQFWHQPMSNAKSVIVEMFG